MLYAAVTLLLGITVLAEAMALKKISENQRKSADELQSTLSIQHQSVGRLAEKIVKMQEKIGNLERKVSCRKPHTPLKDEDFIYRGNYPIRIGRGKVVNGDFLKYVADVGLEVISAELPEDVRTYAVVGKIVEHMSAQLEEQKISTKI